MTLRLDLAQPRYPGRQPRISRSLWSYMHSRDYPGRRQLPATLRAFVDFAQREAK
jgi:hypothetical protein